MGVSIHELITENGFVINPKTGQKNHYGAFAAAAAEVEIPEEVELKAPSDYKIIGTSKKNVDGLKIATGQPLFGIDVAERGDENRCFDPSTRFWFDPQEI